MILLAALIRILCKAIVCLAPALFDIYYYRNQKELKIDKGLPVSSLTKWLFTPGSFFGFQGYPRYRGLQKIVEVGCIIILFLLYLFIKFSFLIFIIDFIALLISMYLMLLERLYYFLSETDYQLIEFQKSHVFVYWLARPWFLGWFLWRKKRFTKKAFNWCAIVALTILILSSFIGL